MFKTTSSRYRKMVPWLLVIVLTIQLVFMVFWANQKYSFHVDEYFSYGFANYTSPFLYPSVNGSISDDLNQVYGHWIAGQTFKDYIEVGSNEIFDYITVYQNQANDAHPPLYFFLLHAVASLGNRTFTKWTGLSINLLFFLLSQIVLFLLGKRVLKSNACAWGAIILWGFGVGAVNNLLLIRMYMMLTFWVLLTTYLHARLIQTSSRFSTKLIQIFFVSLAGYLTHHYFLVYAFCLSLFSIIYLFIRKENKKVLIYMLVMAASVASFVLIFPAVINQLGIGIRGKEAVANIITGKLTDNLGDFLSFIFREIFGFAFMKSSLMRMFAGLIYYACFGVLIILLLRFLVKQQRNRTINTLGDVKFRFKAWLGQIKLSDQTAMLIYLAAVQITFLLLVSKIAPYMWIYMDRYVFGIFPLAAFFGVIGLQVLIKKVPAPQQFGQFILCICLVCMIVSSHLTYGLTYLYPVDQNKIELEALLTDANCLYVSAHDYLLHSNSQEFMNCKQVLPISGSCISFQTELINQAYPEGKLIVLINTELDEDRLIKALLDQTNYNQAQLVSKTKIYELFAVYELT